MDLYVFRHGSAESAEAAGGEEKRRLTERGENDVRAVAQALKRAAVAPEIILTSNLTRAKQTGAILADALAVFSMSDDHLQPGFELSDFQELCSNHKHDRVLIVGHEPDLSTLIRDLTGARVKLSTSGVAAIALEDIAAGKGVLHWLLARHLLPD